MRIPTNALKAALRRQETTFGLWLALANSYCAEICAGAGFDWVLIDGEHAPNDIRSILGQLQAVSAYPAHAVVRPVSGDVHLIKQLLDLGVQTLLLPMVETAEQARHLVAAMHYSPKGMRGVGAAIARASRWQAIPEYLHEAEEELCLIVQIETREGLNNLDAIAAVEGVDCLFIGPSDLAASLGHRGDPLHPEVHGAIADAVRRIRAAGKAAGILGTQEHVTREYLAFGCNFVAVGADTMLLAGSARALAAKFKGIGSQTEPVLK